MSQKSDPQVQYAQFCVALKRFWLSVWQSHDGKATHRLWLPKLCYWQVGVQTTAEAVLEPADQFTG